MSYDPQSEHGWDAPPGGPPSGGPPPPGPPPPPGGWGPPPPPGYGPPPGYQGAPGGYQGGYQQPYPPSQYGGYPPVYPGSKRTDGTAIGALILAIASFVICPLIPAIIALVLIPGSRRTIRASGGTIEGEGLLTAAKIISLINIGLSAVVFVGFVIAIIVAAGSSSSSSLGAPLVMLG
jgi:hypothetical protein